MVKRSRLSSKNIKSRSCEGAKCSQERSSINAKEERAERDSKI
jgi:hypothetical protein